MNDCECIHGVATGRAFGDGGDQPRYLEIQRCDLCAKYDSDMDAALAVLSRTASGNAYMASLVTREMTPFATAEECEAIEHPGIIIVPYSYFTFFNLAGGPCEEQGDE